MGPVTAVLLRRRRAVVVLGALALAGGAARISTTNDYRSLFSADNSEPAALDTFEAT